jgi:hypothetical protein
MFRWLGKLLGFGSSGPAPVTTLAEAATGVAEVFTENKTKRMQLDASARAAALAQFAAEFNHQRLGWFDRFVDSLNRLPRPVMALMTLWLFYQAWSDPATFASVMGAFDTVPEQLWWLLGAVVAFYFGARETHHFRRNTQTREVIRAASEGLPDVPRPPPGDPDAPDDTSPPNAALEEWRSTRSRERTS